MSVILQDIETGAADSLVPTVTAITSSPDLRWMVQPTVLTSVSPSSSRAKPKTNGATQSSSPAGATKAKPSNRKGQKEQVCKEEMKCQFNYQITQVAYQSFKESLLLFVIMTIFQRLSSNVIHI